ncbi:MAG: type II toxin-antitoxin system death-on-curing family toxin [Parcubacteria group bacterium]
MLHFLNTDDIKNICFQYAETYLSYDEPIPCFESRYADKLDAILAMPQQMISNKFLYPTLPDQAAVLFYEMIKQHPLLNGNKRIACVALMVFLSLNGKWMNTGWKNLYDIAVTVASSQTDNRGGVLNLLVQFLAANIV